MNYTGQELQVVSLLPDGLVRVFDKFPGIFVHDSTVCRSNTVWCYKTNNQQRGNALLMRDQRRMCRLVQADRRATIT